jgi:peroxiredoxin family protein
MTNPKMERLSIVIYDGHFDKVHYGLAMASSAAAMDIPVTLFFTMSACRGLMDDWRDMPISPGQEIESRDSGGSMDERFAEQKIATFDELLSACVEMDVTFMVCEMGLKARDLSADDLRKDVPIKPGGLVTFLSDTAQHGNVVFI